MEAISLAHVQSGVAPLTKGREEESVRGQPKRLNLRRQACWQSRNLGNERSEVVGLGLGQSPISRSGVGASEVNVYIHGYITHYSGQCMVFLLLWRAQIAPPHSQSSEGVLGLEGCCKGVLPNHSQGRVAGAGLRARPRCCAVPRRAGLIR
jgi:hypothetical protein